MRESSSADPEMRPPLPKTMEKPVPRKNLTLYKGETMTFLYGGIIPDLAISVDDITIINGVPVVKVSFPEKWWKYESKSNS